MAIETEVTDLNSVEEEYRAAYVEKEGKFILDVEKYGEIRVAPLNRKNQELLNEKRKLADEKKALDEKSRSGLSDVEKQLAEKDERIKQLESSNREHRIWGPVRNLAAKSGVIAEMIEPLVTILKSEGRFDLEDDKLIYKDKAGYPTDIRPERAFEVYLRSELPRFFEASKAAGSGAQNAGKGQGARAISLETFDSMSQEDRWKAHREGVRIIE